MSHKRDNSWVGAGQTEIGKGLCPGMPSDGKEALGKDVSSHLGVGGGRCRKVRAVRAPGEQPKRKPWLGAAGLTRREGD